MRAQDTTRKPTNCGRRPQASGRSRARSISPQSQRNASNRRVSPVPPSPHPPCFEGNSPGPNSKDISSPLPTPQDNDPSVSVTTGKTKWTASELWSLTLAVHDKQPYTAKHTEKAGRWDAVRDMVNKEGDRNRSSKSYQVQMKRLLSWQHGSTVCATTTLLLVVCD